MLGQVAAFDNRRSRLRKIVKIFQRFEVWLLLLLAAGAMAWVFKPSSSEEGRPAGFSATFGGDSVETPMVVHRLSLERDHDNARLDIDVRLTNRHAKKLALAQPSVKLVAGSGRLVPEFFLPMEPPPAIAAKTTADVRLRYWLKKTDLSGPLTLNFEDQLIELKSARPFDLGKLKNGEPKSFGTGDWGM